MQGEELKALREAAGMSQAELADEIGMSRESIGKMERGQAPIEKRTELAAQYVIEQVRLRMATTITLLMEACKIMEDVDTFGVAYPKHIKGLREVFAQWAPLGGENAGAIEILAALGGAGLALDAPLGNVDFPVTQAAIGVARKACEARLVSLRFGNPAPIYDFDKMLG